MSTDRDEPIMINILFAAHSDRWDEYQAPLTKALNAAGLTFDTVSYTHLRAHET